MAGITAGTAVATSAAVSGAAASTASAAPAVAATSAAAAAVASSAPAAAVSTAVSSASTATSASGALDFGSCSDPAIEFANGLDGRNEPAFIAVNQQDFSHGSALNIGVIASFICGELSSKCKANAAALTACSDGETAAGMSHSHN